MCSIFMMCTWGMFKDFFLPRVCVYICLWHVVFVWVRVCMCVYIQGVWARENVPLWCPCAICLHAGFSVSLACVSMNAYDPHCVFAIYVCLCACAWDLYEFAVICLRPCIYAVFMPVVCSSVSREVYIKLCVCIWWMCPYFIHMYISVCACMVLVWSEKEGTYVCEVYVCTHKHTCRECLWLSMQVHTCAQYSGSFFPIV
jgi:hypothetical protein